MLTKTRQEEILNLVNTKQGVTLSELVTLYNASESTIRRDIVHLDSKGLLTKVFGGAVAKKETVSLAEPTVLQKKPLNVKAKIDIAKYAATLIEPYDLVYIDAGTTTEYLTDFIKEKDATYVTNAIEHAKKLANSSLNVILIGGSLKKSTEAIVGSEAILNIQKYFFTKGFFATNAVDEKNGFTTPDINEANVKTAALKNTEKAYMLCDDSKFNQTLGVAFGSINDFTVITNKKPKNFNGDIISID